MASFSADLLDMTGIYQKASRVDSIEIKPLGVNSYGYWGKGEEQSGLNGEEKQLALSVIKESVEVKTVQKHPLQGIMRKTASFILFICI